MAKRVILFPKPDLSAPINTKVIGDFVRHKRTSAKMTLEDTASLCGLSKQAYNNVELGVENIRVDTLFKALRGMGVKLSIIDNTNNDGDWG